MRYIFYKDYIDREYLKLEEDDGGIEIPQSLIDAVENAFSALQVAESNLHNFCIQERLKEDRKLEYKKRFIGSVSRNEKHKLLVDAGWVPIDVSYYTKDGNTLKMHEAFNILKEYIFKSF